MPRELTAESIHDLLADALEDAVARQATAEDDPRRGGVVNLESSLPTARATGQFLTACLYQAARNPSALTEDRLRRMLEAVRFLRRVQRTTGRFDEPDCNIDSGPVTAFLLQQLLPALRATPPEVDSDLEPMLAELRPVIERGMTGMLDGGFHTPNHRWVWASALAQTAAFLDIETPAVLGDILAEGIDIDADGAYLERSIETYDAVTDLSLLLLDEHVDWPDALPAVRRNLDFDTYLLHANGTVETCLSRRWGGLNKAPLTLAAAALAAADVLGEGRYAALARTFWQAGTPGSLGPLAWLAWAATRHPRSLKMEGELPACYTRWFTANGLWRHRQGRTDASILSRSPDVLTFRHGGAQLARMTIRFSYFGAAGDFVGVPAAPPDEEGIVLDFDGLQMPRRPGYEMPLGRPVAPADWDGSLELRQQRQVDPQAAELTVRPVEAGVQFHLANASGLEGVPAQIALDFPPSGRWRSACDIFEPAPGQSIVLLGGSASMHYGVDAIHIDTHRPATEPRARLHTWPAMRDSSPVGDLVRVVIPLVTPVDIRATLTGHTGP